MLNKTTLLVDGNWCLMWRLFSCKPFVTKSNLEAGLYSPEEAVDQIKKALAQAVSSKLNQMKGIVDNFIYISDDSSWRKDLPLPRSLQSQYNRHIESDVTYKGQRVRDDELDWSLIYRAHREFIESLEREGITCSHLSKIEGDDWVFWWSRYLNENGINCLIWSKDQDLKQLINFDTDRNVFTAWHNDDNGIFFPECLKPEGNDFSSGMDIMDQFGLFCDELQYSNEYIHKLKTLYGTKVTYLNPMEIVITKIISGDAGDNIQPIIYKYSNTAKPRRYKATEKDVMEVVDELGYTSVTECLDNIEHIIKRLLNNKKFLGLVETSMADIMEHYVYNRKLVWLHESEYPEKVQLSFLQIPYKVIPEVDRYYIFENLVPDVKKQDYMENLYRGI